MFQAWPKLLLNFLRDRGREKLEIVDIAKVLGSTPSLLKGWLLLIPRRV